MTREVRETREAIVTRCGNRDKSGKRDTRYKRDKSDKRDTIAKARFEETKGSIERGEAHIANIELMSVQTPEGQAALE